MMTDEQALVFLNGVKKYFNTIGDTEIVVKSPFLIDRNAVLKAAQEYSGIIKVTGLRNGIVYFTASKIILERILEKLNEKNITPAILLDLVGEIANILAGNARKEFGEKFEISTPSVIEGLPSVDLFYNSNLCMIPLEWDNASAAIVISMEE